MLHRRLIIDGQEYPLAVGQSGTGPPTDKTPGCCGCTYLDTYADTLYVCTSDTGGKCIWSVASGSSMIYFKENTSCSGISVISVQIPAGTSSSPFSIHPKVNDLVISASGQLFKVTSATTTRVSMSYLIDLKGGGGTGTEDHSALKNRDAVDQHPIGAITGLEPALASKFDGAALVNGYLYMLSNGKTVAGPIGPFFSGPTYSLTITNLMDSETVTILKEDRAVLRFNYASVNIDGADDGPGLGQVLIDGVVRQTFAAIQGDNEVDITEYIASGENNVVIRITNSEDTSKLLSYTVTVVLLHLASSFDASVPYSGDIHFVYTPTGITEKVMHFEMDGEEIGTATVTTSGRQQSFTIPAQSHGAHVFRVWFTCDISGTTLPSNVLYYSLMCIVDGDTTPIIALSSPPVADAEQYSSVVNKYRVYNPASLTSAITLEADGDVVGSLTVDRTEQTWTYRIDTVGSVMLTIRCGDVHVSWSHTVTESSINVEAETEALVLHLSSYGRSNNESNPGVWESNGIAAEFSNFNFTADGWKQDDNDITVLRVTGDARLHIPYKMFASDFRTTGKTLEFEFATREVLNYDAEIISCYSGGRGFRITAQQLMLVSEQSNLGTRYKENEHIRVSFVVEKKAENRLILSYVNGILSGAVQYPENDDFSQSSPVGITIGSNECTTDLYTIRVYDNSLTRYQIIDNWIADTQNFQDRYDRYTRNDIYDAYGQVIISKLPEDLPYLVPKGAVLPQFKGDKKTLSDYYVDPEDPEKSYSSSGTQYDVQGTSSQYYYRKNYKIKYKGGFVLPDGTVVSVYAMNDDAIPVDTFTMKADVASSEGAFNVVLSMLYNDLCPYKTPAQIADPRVRQTIEGFPIVIFWDNGSEVKFLGKYNFNNDKGTAEVFGFQNGDESWETLQNGTDRVGWHSADFSGDAWKNDFEARYPEDNTDTTRLQALAEWLVSTDTDQATGNAITPVTYDGVTYEADTKEYRLAKFSAELADHFIEDALIFYYLFTEMFLSIDQREKNAFPTYLASEDRWIVLFYDADSSCGTDNKGNLTFDYYLEDIDYTAAGDPVYNGQNSVLWKNLRATRYGEIMAMYQQLRVNGQVSYDIAINRFETHQSKWPEAIFNEDMYIKCLEPLILDNDALYLPMLQGKKELWMKWWLYNRFRYLDTKYNTGTSMEKRITIRAHAKENVKLTSYVNMYGHVYYNAEMVEHRMFRGQEYEFVWAASGAEDAVIGINDADMLTSIGDLSPLMVELIDISKATHLTSLKVGDAAEDYVNDNLNSITLGNNILLRTIDLRNCPRLTQSVDVSGCTNIEEAYFDGTSITGLSLPNGGILKKLHVPSTMANLTIRNQLNLTEFVMPSSENVTTLRLEYVSNVVDSKAIIQSMPANSRVRVLGFNWTFDESEDILEFYDHLDSMRGLDENGNNMNKAQMSGTIFVNAVTEHQLEEMLERYPNIAISYLAIKKYIVRFWNGDTLLQTREYDYGSVLSYSQSIYGTPVYIGENSEYYKFVGWDYDNPVVTRNIDTHAVFRDTRLKTLRYLDGTITDIESELVTKVGDYAFMDRKNLKTVNLPNAEAVGKQSFRLCTALESVNLPNVRTLGEKAFQSCYTLEQISVPYVVELPANVFSACRKLTSVTVPNVQTVGSDVFSSCNVLTYLNMPSLIELKYGAVRDTTSLQIISCGALTNARQYSLYAPSITTIILPSMTNVAKFHSGALNADSISAGTVHIYVPSALMSQYRTSLPSAYVPLLRAIEDYPEIIGG